MPHVNILWSTLAGSSWVDLSAFPRATHDFSVTDGKFCNFQLTIIDNDHHFKHFKLENTMFLIKSPKSCNMSTFVGTLSQVSRGGVMGGSSGKMHTYGEVMGGS